jgi:hypothetical protein
MRLTSRRASFHGHEYEGLIAVGFRVLFFCLCLQDGEGGHGEGRGVVADLVLIFEAVVDESVMCGIPDVWGLELAGN